jgi:hypothetical protein
MDRTVSFNRERYENLEDMYKDVAKLTEILVRNEYQVRFYYEDVGIYILQYADDPMSAARYGTANWLLCEPEEIDMVLDYRDEKSRQK